MKKVTGLLFLLMAVCVSAQTTLTPIPYLKKNDKYIYVDKHMKPVISAEFDEANPFFYGVAVVKVGNYYGYIDVNGNYIVKPTLESAENFSEGLGVFKGGNSKKFGVVDKIGKTVLPDIYDNIYSAKNGMLRIKFQGKLGFANLKGTEVIPCRYIDDYGAGAQDFSFNRSTVKINGLYGCIDRKGNLCIENKYSYIGPFKEGVACAKLENVYGYIDTNGKPVINFEYAYGTDFNSGVAVIKTGNVKNVINKKAEIVIADVNAGNFINGIALFNNYGKPGVTKALWGYIDKTGKIIVDCKYEDASEFREDMARVKVNGKSGFIDITGKMVIDPKYVYAYYFINGYAEVKVISGGKRFYIDKAGKEFREP